jgi:hypothetical protein
LSKINNINIKQMPVSRYVPPVMLSASIRVVLGSEPSRDTDFHGFPHFYSGRRQDSRCLYQFMPRSDASYLSSSFFIIIQSFDNTLSELLTVVKYA